MKPASPSGPRAAAQGGGRVFVSHSSKNKALAEAVAAELESNGIRCWMAPRDIRPGEPNYGKAIIEGLSNCQAMVLLLTEASNRSQHVMKEAERAVNRNIPLLVARFQPIGISKELEYYVSSAQFLDATERPLQQHIRTIRLRVGEMLAASARGLSAGEVVITVAPRPRRRNGNWGLRLAGLGLVAALAISGWWLAVPRLQAIWSNMMTAIAQTARPSSPPPVAVEAAMASTPSIAPEPTPASGGSGSLLASVEAKAELNGSLAAFAASRLANFHREALTVTKTGGLTPGKVTDSDAEILASCRIQPNMTGYASLARELIGLFDKVALVKGTITSDGLKTSERYGHDARPHIQEIVRASLGSSGGLLDIFASDAHETLVRQHAGTGSCPYVSFATAFLIYDEKITGEYESGISNLRWLDARSWRSLLNQQGTGIVVVLESAKNSFRHTNWRWFHLSPSDWKAIATNSPFVFKCVFALTDASGATIESDSYPLKQYGVGLVDDNRIMSLAPFFVNDDFDHTIPEITLTKPVVVLRNDVPRVKDFTVTLEEVRPKAR